MHWLIHTRPFKNMLFRGRIEAMSDKLVIKYGGSAMTDVVLRKEVAREISRLRSEGSSPVVVHGGGPFIKAALATANIESEFVRGLRVTDEQSLPIVEQTLTYLNKQLSQEIGNAIGLSGRDADVVVAKQAQNGELGFVGEVIQVNEALLVALLNQSLIPVIACIAANETGEGVYNVNADSVAGAVAGTLQSPVIFLSDIPGVLDNPEDKTSLLPELSQNDIAERIADGRIAGGMIPKVEAATDALKKGAAFAVIADGRKAQSIGEVLQGTAGTRITP